MQTGFNVFLKSNVGFFIKKPVFVTTLAGSIVSDSLPTNYHWKHFCNLFSFY